MPAEVVASSAANEAVSGTVASAKEQIESLAGDVGDMIKAGTETMGDMIKASTSSVANVLRRILSTSATTLSIGLTGVLVYAVYKSYERRKQDDGGAGGGNGADESFRTQLWNSFQEPDIGRAKRTKEEVEEVCLFVCLLFFTEFISFLRGRIIV